MIVCNYYKGDLRNSSGTASGPHNLDEELPRNIFNIRGLNNYLCYVGGGSFL